MKELGASDEMKQPVHFYSAFFPLGDKLDSLSPPLMQTLGSVSVADK